MKEMSSKMIISPSMSFKNWNIVQFLLGHKKTLITIIGAGLGYFFTNSELIATGSAFVFAALVSISEFYFKDVTA